MPAWANACSYTSVWALTRNSTAISRVGTPWAISSLTRLATVSASAGSSSHSAKTGTGPSGRCATSSSRWGARDFASTLLARPTTWGVER